MKTWICLAALALLTALPVSANEDIVFRCTDANAKVTVQDAPCPSGTAQIIQRRGASSASTASTALGDSPVPAAAAVLDSDQLDAPATGAAAGSGEAILDSDVLRARAVADASAVPDRPPPPVIFRCTSSGGGQYFHEYEAAPSRCTVLPIAGLGGGIAPYNAASCEVVRDACSEVELAQRCGAWQQRMRDARGRESFATADAQPMAREERLRVQAVLEASSCAVP
ncbi:hypothetical protein H9654_05095 [Stenotrophomonas sp. Sa5BUN4]|uniref:DUF4124 domain-containing protein n=1 Tax=Stenotrophomonas lacuserhaii TaxID=2760084 RepID=A0A8X8FSK9_9GAMM|nr:hypothetical protein [Stenotrophomonas pennii]MBD7953579.1 hypothetical protein [Stenotrophomonas pennii]